MASLAPIFAKMESTGGVQCAGGVTDIKQEIQCTTANQQFVLHDSQGFEPGEVENLRIVQDFLRSRNKNVDIREQVDVVWLCMPIPSAGGRNLDIGIERFLDLQMSGKLGKLPVIAVFTKYDELITRATRVMDPSVRAQLDGIDEITQCVKGDADALLQELCVAPFEKYTKKKIPHMTVSTRQGYEHTLRDLVKVSTDIIQEYVLLSNR